MTNTEDNVIDELIKRGDEEADKEEFASAIECYKKYLEKNPTDALLYNRVGYLYGKLNENDYVDEQIKYYKKADELRPDYKAAIRNLALTYPLIDENQKSIEYFHKLFALGAMPDDYFAYACQKIKMGDFYEGWKYYEFRFLKTNGWTEYPKINKPRWEGQDISDKTLLVQYEQGFGDTFQFYRYLDLIRPLAKNVIFRVQNEVFDLMKKNLSWAEVVGKSTSVDDLKFDFHTPLMSLPAIMKTTLDTVPTYSKYLKADDSKVEYYKKKFFDNDCFKIGISWAGMQTGNFRRNVRLRFFYPLTQLKNVKIYAFQKGYGSLQLKDVPENIEIIDLGETFDDFSDTAAAMANLDWFITSDNALFNLAGAMGKNTYVLLNKNSEWRWGFDDITTPWYDNVKIFKKQNENVSWGFLIDKAIEALNEVVEN